MKLYVKIYIFKEGKEVLKREEIFKICLLYFIYNYWFINIRYLYVKKKVLNIFKELFTLILSNMYATHQFLFYAV